MRTALLVSHRWAIPDLERYVVEEIVHCVTLSSLLRKHAITRVDVLCIDTEGHDHEILRQIDFESVRPRVLLYEHEYMRRVERKRCEAMLAGRGFALSRRLGGYARVFTLLPSPRGLRGKLAYG